MTIATSADGTSIAFSSRGDGRTVVIVNGALSTAADAGPLADALVDAGFRAVIWDRRSRGGSGDRAGSMPDDEVADLAAVIAAAGGSDAVLGHSSGAVLALYAAAQGVATGALFLSEPPIDFDGSGYGPDLAERLQSLVDDGRPAEAVAAFQLEAVGLPREMVDAGRTSGMLDALAPLGQSTVYDVRLTSRLSAAWPRAARGGAAGHGAARCADLPVPDGIVRPAGGREPGRRARDRAGVGHAPPRSGRDRPGRRRADVTACGVTVRAWMPPTRCPITPPPTPRRASSCCCDTARPNGRAPAGTRA
ncbi:alpha/beta hydrolase [Microbacterium esteraromaticum]|uniref:alpha/beta hydrolase n=1 Tax=Microbacterium esteraromaticum TaxID=57043 RepID=UPI00309E058C